MAKKVLRGFEPRSLDSESRVLTVTPRGRITFFFCFAKLECAWIMALRWLICVGPGLELSLSHFCSVHKAQFNDLPIVRTHQWSSGRIHRCHRCDPGSIPG